MLTEVRFYGPVDIYGHRRKGEWEAWADPFSVVGTGRTFKQAILNVQKHVEQHFEDLAEAIHEHGRKVDILCPLRKALKKTNAVKHFLVYCVQHVPKPAPWRLQPRKLSKANVRAMLKCNGEIGLVPALK